MPHAMPFVTMDMPPPEADWFGSETVPTVHPLLGMPTHHHNSWADTGGTIAQVLGSQTTSILRNAGETPAGGS